MPLLSGVASVLPGPVKVFLGPAAVLGLCVLCLKCLQLKAVLHHREIKTPSLTVQRKGSRIEGLPHTTALAICVCVCWAGGVRRGEAQKGVGRLVSDSVGRKK